MAILHFQKPDELILHKITDFEGQFEFRPLEPGYGLTVGNALRRVLLGSLEGYAIVGIKIEGVDHEFSTIKGVKEDVTEMILNLKQARFKKKIEDDSITNETISLTLKNVTKFTAKMLGEASGYFQTMNPDLHICTLDDSTTLIIDITISKGRGYVPSEDNKIKDAPLRYIPIDSIHTPIKNVKYTVENCRVEQRTDYEKLILDVVTDGTIHPKEAVKEASRILIDHLAVISERTISIEKKEEAVETVENETAGKLRKVLRMSLEDLDLSVRAFNCLKAAKINSLSALVQCEQEDLMKFRNFGQKSLTEIEQVLGERGLHFGMDLEALGLDSLDDESKDLDD